jgi:uncharacterized protein
LQEWHRKDYKRRHSAVLIQFRVENHRSLRDEQTLSLVASTLEASDSRLIRPEDFEEALLPALAIYGANASGKTNVLAAMAFMRTVVLRSHRYWEPDSGTAHEPFLLSDKAQEPSLYEVDILLAGVRHRYGFVLGRERIEEEWLHVWPHGRKQVWFEREADKFEFGKNFHGENEAIRGLTRTNSLFLAAAAQNNHAQTAPVFNWFRRAVFELRRGSHRSSVLPTSLFSSQLSLFPDDGESQQLERDAIVQLLRAADVGILDVKVTSRERSPGPFRVGGQSVDVFLLHDVEQGERGWLPLEMESAGTITLLELATRLVRALRYGSVFCIDELEASLHPALGLELLRMFQSRPRNPNGSQLIFTTHDTNLLGNVLGEPPLRRDQIWFTEKDRTGATHLYPLTDYSPRREENLERGYLQGRYGAIPFLGQFGDDPNPEKENR